MADISPSELAKFAAAQKSVAYVESGMKLGLGTGSTAAWMVRCLAARVQTRGLVDLLCVPTSDRTAAQATALGLRVVSLDEAGQLDLTIDGADEIDPQMRLIKGGGGAHLREKIVAAASDRMVVIADPGKQVDRLGAFDLPIEVIPFGLASTMSQISAVLATADVAGRQVTVRQAGDAPFRSDEGNIILDAALSEIAAPEALAQALSRIPGVVETGLFLDLCHTTLIGHTDGRVDITEGPGGTVVTDQVDPAEAASLPG